MLKGKKAIILIHGFLTDIDDFGCFVEIAMANYDEVIRVLIPGHGPNANSRDFTVDNAINTVLAEYEKVQDYETIDVVGFSMGGALSCYLACYRRISKLVLLTPANQYLNFKSQIERIKYLTEYLKVVKLKQGQNYQEISSMHTMIKEDEKLAIDVAKNKLLRSVKIHNLLTFRKLISHINSSLKPFDVPTLLLWGDMDQLVPRKSITLIEKYAKNLSVHILPGITHLMYLGSNCQSITDLILPFLGINEIEKS